MDCFAVQNLFRGMGVYANYCRVADFSGDFPETRGRVRALFPKAEHIDFQGDFLLLHKMTETGNMLIINFIRTDIIYDIRMSQIEVFSGGDSLNHEIGILF